MASSQRRRPGRPQASLSSSYRDSSSSASSYYSDDSADSDGSEAAEYNRSRRRQSSRKPGLLPSQSSTLDSSPSRKWKSYESRESRHAPAPSSPAQPPLQKSPTSRRVSAELPVDIPAGSPFGNLPLPPRLRATVYIYFAVVPKQFKKWHRHYVYNDFRRLQYGALEACGVIYRHPGKDNHSVAVVEQWSSTEAVKGYIEAEKFRFSQWVDGAVHWYVSPHTAMIGTDLSRTIDLFCLWRRTTPATGHAVAPRPSLEQAPPGAQQLPQSHASHLQGGGLGGDNQSNVPASAAHAHSWM
eukprot:jgi/Mesvir1/8159/Mv12468-RA.1